jgi:hypothetical protein
MQPNIDSIDDANKPFHSNGYAQVASGNRIGATSNISFNQRQVIESSRRIIGEYKHSKLGTLRGILKANPSNINNTNNSVLSPKPSRQEFNSSNKPVSLKSQNYNPYS